MGLVSFTAFSTIVNVQYNETLEMSHKDRLALLGASIIKYK